MKFRPIGILLLIGFCLCMSPPEAFGGASDTWAQHKKVLIGQFNNWTPQSMTGPDSNGMYRVEVKVFPGTWQYKFGVVLNGTDTQYEPTLSTLSGNREIVVPEGAETIYAPSNWADTPPKPTSVTTSLVDAGKVKLTWSEATPGGLDVIHGGGYHVYYRAGAAGPPWTKADTQLLTSTTYTVGGLTTGTIYYFVITAVDAYDTPAVPATDSPAPPGPLMDTSSIVSDTPLGKILVQFILDLRNEISAGGAPKFGMGIGGNQSPLSWRPYESPLREVQTGIWTESYMMQAGQTLEYKYVKNPGTSKQEWEGSGDQFSVLFRFDPASWGLSAANVTDVYVRGSFNSFGVTSDWKMTKDADGVFRLVKSTSGSQTFKYYVYHSGAPLGDWIPSGSDLSMSVSEVPTQFIYGPDTSSAGVYITGNFDPYTGNWWHSDKQDDFHSLVKDNRGMWRLTRNMRYGTYQYKFILDSTNDGVKSGSFESGSDRALNVTGNRMVSLMPNYGPSTLRLVDVWEQAAFAPPKSPISITAVSMDSQVLLSWRPSRDFVVNSYNVYRDTDKNGTFKLLVTVPASTLPEYTDTGAENGKTYYYKITAYDTSSLLESNYSATQEGMPAVGNAKARRMADGQETSVMIEFPAGSLPAGTFLRITSMLEAMQEQTNDSDMSKMMEIVSAGNAALLTNPLEWVVSENNTSDSDALIYMVELKSKTTGQNAANFVDSPVKIAIPYTTGHEQMAATGGLKFSGMALYVLNETTRRWEKVAGSTANTTSKTISAPRYAFSIFQVLAVAAPVSDLGNMVAFPNPCYPNRDFAQRGDPFGDGRPGITFMNIPKDMEYIKIYTITGELVRTMDQSDGKEYQTNGGAATMVWDLNNDAGHPVASAVYLFFAKSAAGTRTGKVAVIR